MRTLLSIVVALALVAGVAVAAQQDSPRVISIATAEVEPGHMAEYLDIVEAEIMPFLAAQDVEVIAVLQNQIGGPSNELNLIFAYRDLAHMQAVAENSTLTDIQQQQFEAIRVLSVRSFTPTSFSPLQ